MPFEWDETKNIMNARKHGISFDHALEIFDYIVFTLPDDRQDYGEHRFVSVGLLDDGTIVTVVHTDRNGNTRLISARTANYKERKSYYAYLKTQKLH